MSIEMHCINTLPIIDEFYHWFITKQSTWPSITINRCKLKNVISWLSFEIIILIIPHDGKLFVFTSRKNIIYLFILFFLFFSRASIDLTYRSHNPNGTFKRECMKSLLRTAINDIMCSVTEIIFDRSAPDCLVRQLCFISTSRRLKIICFFLEHFKMPELYFKVC